MPAVQFKELFHAHTDFVWRVLHRHGVPAREMEDACQEVFLVVFRRLPEFEGRSSIRTWIYGIAVRVALALRRRAFMRRELLTSEADSEAPAEVVDLYARQEAQLIIHAALSDLSPPKREVFVLYELEGMTIAETAAALGVPENTALYRLHAARRSVATSIRRDQRASMGRPSTEPIARHMLEVKKGAVS
jgi:RNA polymerase sigma-70 factor (ECF subfamily)